jgi:hypothetical protein
LQQQPKRTLNDAEGAFFSGKNYELCAFETPKNSR